MAATTHPTTSERFACSTCGAPVALLPINPDDLAYVCQKAACGRAVSVDCPEALAIVEPVTLSQPNPIEAITTIATRILSEYDVDRETAALVAQALYRHKGSGHTGRRRLDVRSIGLLIAA
jgi:hypothetical protein